MNLYLDSWIPVRDEDGMKLLTLKQLLCEPEEWQLSLPRDDMELGCVELVVSLVQVALPPANVGAWRLRQRELLKAEEYDEAVAPLLDWFDVDHPKWPFMQTRGVSSSEPTPIQKLLVGLPEGNNHTFFNAPGEATHLSPAAVVIALFNQASNAPNFGGGFKGGLRGTPITTLVAGNDLRQTIWRNVLHEGHLRHILPWYDQTKAQPPVWVEQIKAGEKIAVDNIGLLRGLFWQPAHFELIRTKQEASCDLLGGKPGLGYSGFNKEKFVFEVVGLWPHPHSPREYEVKKGESGERFLGFTTMAPAWTQCGRYLYSHRAEKEGHTPAAIVDQWRTEGEGSLRLIVGGYRNKQASILQRRHEFFSIGDGWQDERGQIAITWAIGEGLKGKTLLRGKLYSVVKGNRDKGIKALGMDIHEAAEQLYYQRTESLIHSWLREMTRSERREERAQFVKDISKICREIFQQVTDPYCRNPALVRTVALAYRSLNNELLTMKESAA